MEKFGNFTARSKLGQGSFGQIYSVIVDGDTLEYALKCESKDIEHPTILFEANILKTLNNSKYFPKYISQGSTATHNYFVMSIHENSLDKVLKDLGKNRFTISTGLRIAKHLLIALQNLHECNLIHRDIKPSNILINKNPPIVLCDFGMARIYSQNGKHLLPRNKPGFRGSHLYSSVNAHQSYELSRRDDIISWFYVVTHLSTGTLPWIHFQDIKDIFRVKKLFDPRLLWGNLAPEMIEIWKKIEKLSYDQTPDYDGIFLMIERAMIRLTIYESDPYDWMTDNNPQIDNVEKDISLKALLFGKEEKPFCCCSYL